MAIKLFQINQSEWVAAETMEQAIDWLADETGCEPKDLVDPLFCREIPADELDKLEAFCDDFSALDDTGALISMAAYLRQMLARGEALPCVFSMEN